MKTIIALLMLAAPVAAQDFNWAFDDPFVWSVTEKGGGPISGTGSGGTAPEPVSQFVHRINVGNGSSGGAGSATHIGGGVFLTCRHVFARQWNAAKIDGVQVDAKPTVAEGPDFAVVRTDAASHASAAVSTAALSDGQRLHVYGAKTGLHSGDLSPKRWSHGYRAVVCAVPTESGDSGAGVFNESGELVGVHWGSTGNEVFFTPLSEVSELMAVTPSSAQDAPRSAAGASPAAESSKPRTTVCQCLGYREHLCHCRRHGQVCHCTRTSGSVWAVNEKGQATHKTGAKADPRGNATVARRNAPSSGSAPSDDAVPRQKSDGKWWWTAPDGVQWWASSQPRSGDVVIGGGVTWDCVDGRMVQRGAKMAVQISPTGHWERRCVGGVCRMYWIEDD